MNRTHRSLGLVAVFASLVGGVAAVGCGEETTDPVPKVDAGGATDGGGADGTVADATSSDGATTVDGSNDAAGNDAAPAGDAGVDAAQEAGLDSGVDAALDAGRNIWAFNGYCGEGTAAACNPSFANCPAFDGGVAAQACTPPFARCVGAATPDSGISSKIFSCVPTGTSVWDLNGLVSIQGPSDAGTCPAFDGGVSGQSCPNVLERCLSAGEKLFACLPGNARVWVFNGYCDAGASTPACNTAVAACDAGATGVAGSNCAAEFDRCVSGTKIFACAQR